MLLRLITFVLSLILVSTFATSSQAHIGGIPFINLNDKPTLVNDFNNYTGRSDIPQDDAPEAYLSNQPIKFEVLQKFLQIPEDVFNQSQFRWKFDQNTEKYETGSLVSYSFDKPKTYFVELQVKGPDQVDFQPLNTLGINIVSDHSYKLPKVTLSAATDNNKPDKPIKYTATIETDPTSQIASYLWDFDDDQTSTEVSPIHKFSDENVIHGVTLKVTDTNGFVGYAGLQIFNNDNKLEISNIKPGEPEVSVDTNFSTSSGINPWLFIIPGIAIFAFFIFFLTRRS